MLRPAKIDHDRLPGGRGRASSPTTPAGAAATHGSAALDGPTVRLRPARPDGPPPPLPVEADSPAGPAAATTATIAPDTLASSRGEVRSLTGLRLFAAAWVVVFHFEFTKGHLLAAVLHPAFPLVTTGAMGVDLFYVLSGFVIAFTYLDKLGRRFNLRTTGRFLWARVCRIWPVYALVTTVFWAYLLVKMYRLGDPKPAYQNEQPDLGVLSWLRQLATVQIWTRPWHDGVSFVGPAWSISAEMLAYVLFPLAALLFFRLRGAPRWLLAAVAVGLMAPVATLCLLTGSPYFPYSWMVRILAGFTAGVLAYLVVREIPRTERATRIAGLVSWALLIASVAGLWLGDLLGPVGTSTERGGMILVLFPPLVGALALAGNHGPGRLLATRGAVHGGRISYSLYLVHVPVFEVFWGLQDRVPAFHPNGLPSTLLTPVALAATFLAAHLLYRYIEEPARHLLRR